MTASFPNELSYMMDHYDPWQVMLFLVAKLIIMLIVAYATWNLYRSAWGASARIVSHHRMRYLVIALDGVTIEVGGGLVDRAGGIRTAWRFRRTGYHPGLRSSINVGKLLLELNVTSDSHGDA